MEIPPEPTHTDDQLTEEAPASGPQHKEVIGNMYLAVPITISHSQKQFATALCILYILVSIYFAVPQLG